MHQDICLFSNNVNFAVWKLSCDRNRLEKQIDVDNDKFSDRQHAASDLLISVFAVPRELVEIFAGPRRWLLDGLTGLILCKLVYFFQDISAAVSIQSLVVIAIERYRGVVFPFRPPIITSKVCKMIIPIIWIVAMCLHGSYFYTARLVMQSDNRWYCTFSWAPEFDEQQTQEQYFVVVSVF